MKIFDTPSILNVIKELPNDDACKVYLANLKWSTGFICTKCGGNKGCRKSGYTYHCYSCNHVETASSNTLFHKVKFGLHKAFCIVLEMSTSGKRSSSVQMGKRFDLRQGTAWYFMQKVRKAMKSHEEFSSIALIHLDEFRVAEKEVIEPREGDFENNKAITVVELTREKKVKRAYIKSNDDSISLITIFETDIE